MQIKYYIDMDGVLAKWNEYASEEETHEPGYFINRDVQKNAVAMVNLLANAGEDVKILSSMYEDDHSAVDKEKWLKKHGIKIPHIFVPYGKDKYSYIDAEKDDLPVLIDDYSKNLNAWEKKGYLPIKLRKRNSFEADQGTDLKNVLLLSAH